MTSNTANNEKLLHDGWGDVREISQHCHQLVVATSFVVPILQSFQSHPEQFAGQEDLIKACKALLFDMPNLQKELSTLDNGVAKVEKPDGDDIDDGAGIVVIIQVHQRYMEWMDKFTRLIQPNLNVVQEAMSNLDNQTIASLFSKQGH